MELGFRTSNYSSLRPSNIRGPMKAFGNVNHYLLPQRDTIKFYDKYDDYYEFTNFYSHPVRIDGHWWPTTEHYFQAQKFVGTPYYDHIRKLPMPRDAFRVSRDPVASRWVRGDWNAVKDDVMLKALRAKFEDSDLKKRLLGTKDKKLVEHTVNDSYWGDGGDGRGRNKLGELLMRVRSELKTSVPESKRKGVENEAPFTGFKLKRSNSLSSLHRVSEPMNSSLLYQNDIIANHSIPPIGTMHRRPSTPTLRRKADIMPVHVNPQQNNCKKFLSPRTFFTPPLKRKSSDSEYTRTSSRGHHLSSSDVHSKLCSCCLPLASTDKSLTLSETQEVRKKSGHHRSCSLDVRRHTTQNQFSSSSMKEGYSTRPEQSSLFMAQLKALENRQNHSSHSRASTKYSSQSSSLRSDHGYDIITNT